MTTRKRTPRKTPPGKKSLPRKISPEDLAKWSKLAARREQLNQAEQELAEERLRLQGRWAEFREGIEPRYQMVEADRIADDGTINRNT